MSISRSRSRGAQAQVMPYAEETKYFDTSQQQLVASASDWTGTEVSCTNYLQSDGVTVGAYTDSALIPSAIGAAYGQVVGSKYHLKKIRVRGLLQSPIAADSADVLAANHVRVCLVLDTRPDGLQAQGEAVFTDMGTAAQCNFSFLAMAAGSGGRFRILKDFMCILQPASSGTDGTNTNSVVRSSADFSFTWKPRKPLKVQLKASSATPTVASLSSANVFLLAHCAVAASAPTLSACARAYYMG